MPLLELEGAEARYGAIKALHGVTLEVGEREVVSVLGAPWTVIAEQSFGEAIGAVSTLSRTLALVGLGVLAGTAILGLLRRYQALAQVQKIESQLLASLGLEPAIGSTSELSLAELTEQVGRSNDPLQMIRAAGAKPKAQ